ncbi:fungal-specific transcription factor domain-containing protein [Schizothecium vesticola]|uniref:Fungal-specific transcription factor domain-containing protein n=1 Tax=Schizothecium vesticola TaxID=314040 RepID=A0AA40BTK3_9PEZI|nr:fungal-specific transcription factor domain-containing protein [Schizothecium vesticola]
MASAMNPTLPPPKQIRFVNNQGQPPSKRRRINAACLTCRKRKTRCAGEKPVCSTCTKNGHDCLGYNDLIEKKRDNDNGLALLKFEPSDATDLSAEPELENEYLDDDDDDDDDDERRHWKAKPPLRTASFADRDVKARRDSTTSAMTPSTRTRGRSDEQEQDDRSRNPNDEARRQSKNNAFARHPSYSEDGRSSHNRSPIHTHKESHRMPYFRYFGPTAIVPGYKQVVVNVSVSRERRLSRGSSLSTLSPGNYFGGYGVAHTRLSHPETILETLEDLPVYDTGDQGPVHELIITLIKTFFLHLGCNYPFLKESRFLPMVKERRAEPMLVNAVCALAARFSDLPIFTNDHDGRVARSEYGHIFAQRAKAATIDTFPCPTVAAVQACLLMAYEGFGENQDSTLWMYLGLAIRMAVDLGLQRKVGIQHQGLDDTWYTRNWNGRGDHDAGASDENQDDEPTPEEQHELEEERTATFWAVFVLDRVISSGTGRPVTFRDHDYDLEIPPPTKDPVTGFADPLPAFIEIIHLYGRVSDVLNNTHSADDFTKETMAELAQMESDLTHIYQKQDGNLHFNAVSFREYVKAGHGTTFILMHFWFHALIIVLHEPTLTTGSPKRTRLLPNSRELCMSSAKTIADILAFAELIDPKSFIGNPFTSQPMYIAACAFLVESASTVTGQPSPPDSTTPDSKGGKAEGKPAPGPDVKVAKHSLLASAANQNYQRCYKSLEQLHQYWGGVKYILVALDNKSVGNWDCETFTLEEYNSVIRARRGSLGRLGRLDNPASPNIPPIAWSLTGTTNSPSSNLTLLYQNSQAAAATSNFGPPPPPPANHSVPVSAPTPPGNMIYDPIRQSDTTSMFPPAYPQPNESAVRHQAHPSQSRRQSAQPRGDSMHKYDSSLDDANRSNASHQNGVYIFGGMSQSGHGPPPHHPAYQNSSSQHHHSTSDSAMHHNHNHHNNDSPRNSHGHSNNASTHNWNESDFSTSSLVSGSYPYINGAPINEIITFDSQEINIDALGLPNEMMPPWLEILPGDVLGLFETGLGQGQGQGHGHGGHHMG